MNDGSFAARFSPRSFRIKVTLWLVLAMLILTGLSGILLERVAIDGQFNQLRERLMVIAQISALSIDVKTIQKIPLTRNGVNTRSYKQIKGQLQQILKASPSLNDIYILTKTNQDGIWQFVVDMETSTTGKGRPAAAYPGYQYNVALFPAMMKGFDGPSADSSLEEDEWGVSLSGYAPIRNKTGEALAVLGVDMSADDIRKTIAELNRRLWFILAAGLIVSLVFGLWISRKISDPVKKLAEGTRRIAAGDMQYRVNIETLDEIGELARSFNSMADSLADAQKNLNEYFIRIVQSFVLSLEAKDPYTRGHSERVAGYAEKIALKIGLSAEEIMELKEAALLHDIGKLGIPENILNKTDPLTQQDWDVIRRHPGVGGEILMPVFLNRDMLTVVTGHHERYDGKGYPCGLSSDRISVYAKIVAVADAYDAMTSSRAYRPDMGREKAISELGKSLGTQLDPRIVDIFLEILKEINP